MAPIIFINQQQPLSIYVDIIPTLTPLSGQEDSLNLIKGSSHTPFYGWLYLDYNFMQANKTKQLSLPPIKEDRATIPKISAHQIQPVNQQNAARSKTEPLYSQHVEKKEMVSFVRSEKLQKSTCKQGISKNNSDRKQKKEKGFVQSTKHEEITQLIDTRKSIKILIDYFQNKSLQEKSLNPNCYHSPRRQPVKQETTTQTQDKSTTGIKVVQLKKIKLKKRKTRNHTESLYSPATPHKSKTYNLKEVIKIQNVLTDYIRDQKLGNQKHEKSQRQKLNVSEKKPSNYAANYKKKQKGSVLQRKLTKFDGWPIDYDTQYIQ